jgi:ABC-type amino acid transport substrate-binding protein
MTPNDTDKADLIAVAMLIAVLAIAFVVSVVLLMANDEDEAEDAHPSHLDVSSNDYPWNSENGPFSETTITNRALPTLELVKEQGVLRCGVDGTVPGFSYPNPQTGVMEGMNADYVGNICNYTPTPIATILCLETHFILVVGICKSAESFPSQSSGTQTK